MYRTKFFSFRALALITLSCGLLQHSTITASTLANINQATVETFNNITNALNSLAGASTINQNALSSLIACSTIIVEKLGDVAASCDLETTPNVLQGIKNTLTTLKIGLNSNSVSINPNGIVATSLLSVSNSFNILLQTTDGNSSFFTDSEGNIINSLSSLATIFNAIVNSSSFLTQEDFNTAASIAIKIVAILDRLATAWNLSVGSFATDAHNSLATFSTLTSGVYVYTAGHATKNKIQTASTPINTYIDQLVTAKSIIEYPVPTADSRCLGICAGSDNNVWFTDMTNNNLCKVTSSGSITEYPILHGGLQRICSGSDNALWFVNYSGAISRMTTTGSYSYYSVSPMGSCAICSGPDGNIWFVDGGDRIGKMTLSGTVSVYTLQSSGNNCTNICAGPDGNVWVAEYSSCRVSKTTSSGTITEYSVPSSSPYAICAGPDGNIWTAGNGIFKITTSGTHTKISDSGSSSICTGPDGNIWAASDSNLLKITPSGVVTSYAIPSRHDVQIVCAGPDGNIWFCEESGHNVGKLILNWI